jgi:hypothetical protein
MRYRDVEFYFHEWKNQKGKRLSEFTCDDKKLLKDLETSSFVANDLDSMHNKINYFIDNRESLLHNLEITKRD